MTLKSQQQLLTTFLSFALCLLAPPLKYIFPFKDHFHFRGFHKSFRSKYLQSLSSLLFFEAEVNKAENE